MIQTKYHIEPLDKHHEKKKFSCGIDSLDIYIQKQASQDRRKNIAITYVMIPESKQKVIGYYTLSNTSVNLEYLPESIRSKLPRYPTIPATLLGRLAVDNNCQGEKIGELLLLDALQKSLELSKKIGSIAVIVDAENEAVITFYEKYGFIKCNDLNCKLFLPMKTIEKLFE